MLIWSNQEWNLRKRVNYKYLVNKKRYTINYGAPIAGGGYQQGNIQWGDGEDISQAKDNKKSEQEFINSLNNNFHPSPAQPN